MIIKTSYPFMKPPPSARLIQGHRLAQGLVGHWLFNEDSGNIVSDLSGNGNEMLFVNSPIWSSGKFGSAILFDDGSSQGLKVERAIITGYPFTMIVWFKTDDVTTNQCLCMVCDKDTGAELFRLQIQGTDGGDPLMARVQSDTNGSDTGAKTSNSVIANQWHMGVFLAVSSTERYAILDADFANKGSIVTDTIPVGLDRTSIGYGSDSTPAQYMSGLISHGLIYNRDLFQSEITELYWRSFGMFERKARTALMSGYEVVAPPVGMAGAMTTNTGYWGY